MTDTAEPLLDRLAGHARTRPKAVAYRDAASGEQLSWSDLYNRVLCFSATLRSGLPDDAVVMVVCPNRIEFPVIYLALMHGGFSAFLVTPDSATSELEHLIVRSNAAGVIAASAVLAELPETVEKFDYESAINRVDVFPTALPHGRLLLMSSGSTGLPKIVVRSARSVDAVCDQMVRSIGFSEHDQVLATVPLCHSYGIEHGLLAPVYAGTTTHLCRGLDWPTVLKELAERNITVLPGVPSMFEILANLGSGRDRLPHLRAAYSAGGSLPTSIADRFEERFGVPVGQLYGATEIGSVTYSDARSPTFNPSSVGVPMPGVRVRIDGEVSVSAASLFDGYLDVPGSSLVDGFYPTGDLGEFDSAGNLVITGRIKLLLEIGGLKVNPLEVEGVLRQHPDVADCVVVPVRQSETILRLKAIVTVRDSDRELSFAELRSFARQRLASYKVPRLFERRESLPRTAAGKIQRHLVQV